MERPKDLNYTNYDVHIQSKYAVTPHGSSGLACDLPRGKR